VSELFDLTTGAFDSPLETWDGLTSLGSVGYGSIKVEFGFSSDPLAMTITWTDVKNFVRAVDVTRGRSQPLSVFSAGTATIVLSNQDGRFDPDNTAGPYYTNLLPMVPCRISYLDSAGTRYYIFYGYVQPRDGWHNDYTAGKMGQGDGSATTTVTCVDFLYVLSTQKVDDAAAEFFGANVGTLLATLTTFGIIPSPISLGWTLIGTSPMRISQYVGGGFALDFLHTLADTEGGFVYVAADGHPTFVTRYATITETTMKTPQATFDASGATGESFSIVGFAKAYARDFYNSVSVQSSGLDNVDNTDPGLITQFTESNVTLSTFNETLADAFATSDMLLWQFKTPAAVPVSLVLNPRHDTNTLDDALHLDLRYRATVKYKPPGLTSTISTDVFVEQIVHHWDINGTWDVTMSFASAATIAAYSTFFILGTDKPDGTKTVAF
jgi:hypothetical protein